MADPKRSSMGGNRSGTSTPRPGAGKGPTATGPGELDFGKVIGARVKITISAPASQPIEGTIFTADPVSGILALNTKPTSSASTPTSYMLVPIPRIQSFNIIALPPTSTETSTGLASTTSTFENLQPPVAKIDLNALRATEASAIMKIKERDAMIGKGVSKEAQEIFDALSRTLPCRWHETTIIVNDNVIIQQPYRAEDCSAPKGQDNALARVRRVLENERRKIAERTEGKPSTGNSGKAAAVVTPSVTTAAGSGRGGPGVATPLPRKGG